MTDVSGGFYAGTRTVSGRQQGYLARIGTTDYTALKPISGADNSVVAAIRANGDAVGYSYVSGNTAGAHATLWTGGHVYDLGVGAATAISSNGIIVGLTGQKGAQFSTTASPVSLGSISNSDISQANGVSASGTVVGISGSVAFSYQNGQFFDLTFQGSGTRGNARAINDSGSIVGAIDSHPFFTAGGNVVQFLQERDSTGQAEDVNAAGLIVGESGATHSATLWQGGTGYTLNNQVTNLGHWDLTNATDIDDSGRIIGYGTLSGARHAYALVPGSAKLNGKGTLSVSGSRNDDTMSVGVKSGRLRVSINGSLQTFTPNKVKRINVSLGDGDDDFSLGAGVIGAGIDGGNGNDTLSGGDNSDHLVGGSGNDKLIGNGSRDWLEGGAGNDTLLAARASIPSTAALARINRITTRERRGRTLKGWSERHRSHGCAGTPTLLA